MAEGRTYPLLSTREHVDWQRRAVWLLASLLERAQTEQLPVLTWTIGGSGAWLIGHVDETASARAREHFDRWADALGAKRWPDITSGMRLHVHAVAEHYDGLVTVSVVAHIDIHPPSTLGVSGDAE